MEELLKVFLSNPESATLLLHTYVEKYKPVAYAAGRELLGVAKDYADCKDVFEVTAKIKKNQFDAYVNAGFTEDQAIAFILNDNLQLVKNLKEVNGSTKKSDK